MGICSIFFNNSFVICLDLFPKNKFFIFVSIILIKVWVVSIYSIKKSIILLDNMHNLSKAISPSIGLFNSIK